METILDACSIINLTNSNYFDIILRLPERKWFVGQIVYEECNSGKNLLPELEQAIEDGYIILLSGEDIDALNYLHLLESYHLGDGETECLAYSLEKGFIVCSDDGKARKIISMELGIDKVIGSLGLMKEAVEENLLTTDKAKSAYETMLRKGGFLPDIPDDFFD